MQELIQRRAALKKKLKERQLVFGTWTSLGHPSITEIFAGVGADFLGIDLEHSTISQEQSQRIITASQALGGLCLPRVASHNPEMVRRLLDSGADGIIVPMVQDLDDVDKMIAWAKYPPLGRRGFGVSRAQGYGKDFDEYTKTWNDTSILIGQIESVQAVGQIDKILSCPDLDAVMVGPYDISGSLGIPGQLEHPKVIEACRTVIEAAKRSGKSCATQIIEPDQAKIQNAQAQGFTFIILSSDVFLLWKWSQKMHGLINSGSK